jgi:hypothetical protein
VSSSPEARRPRDRIQLGTPTRPGRPPRVGEHLQSHVGQYLQPLINAAAGTRCRLLLKRPLQRSNRRRPGAGRNNSAVQHRGRGPEVRILLSFDSYCHDERDIENCPAIRWQDPRWQPFPDSFLRPGFLSRGAVQDVAAGDEEDALPRLPTCGSQAASEIIHSQPTPLRS